jgi:hypothetical protein
MQVTRRVSLFVFAASILASLPRSARAAGGSYRRVATANLRDISMQGEISLPPREVVRVFGAPTEEAWDSESLGAIYFEGPKGSLVTLYYRAYDLEPEQFKSLKQRFWKQSTPVELHIGARSEVGIPEFKLWLRAQLGRQDG